MGKPSLLACCSILAFAGAARAQPPEFDLRLDTSLEPQIADAAAAYDAAGPVRGDLVDGVLLCRAVVSSARQWDNTVLARRRAPDVALHLVDGARTRVGVAPGDSHTGVVSFPGVTLRRGGTVLLRVEDVDRRGSEHVGEVRATYRGALPLAFPPAPYATVECRGLSAADARRALSERLAAAEAAVTALEQAATPDLRQRDAGWPRHAAWAARSALVAAAGYAGWAHAELTALRARFEGVGATFEARKREAARTLFDALPPATEDVAVEGSVFAARADGLECEGRVVDAYRRRLGDTERARLADGHCLLRLQLLNRGTLPAELERDFGQRAIRASLLWPDARATHLEAVAFERRGRRPIAGETLEVPAGRRAALVLAVPRDPELGHPDLAVRPRLLQLLADDGVTILRLE